MASRLDELKECLARIFKPEIEISYDAGSADLLRVYAGPLTLFFSKPCLEAPECDIEFYAKAQILSAIRINWLQVLGATELAQIDQRVGHQLHAIMPLLDTFKS